MFHVSKEFVEKDGNMYTTRGQTYRRDFMKPGDVRKHFGMSRRVFRRTFSAENVNAIIMMHKEYSGNESDKA
jgi:hypothetical protein